MSGSIEAQAGPSPVSFAELAACSRIGCHHQSESVRKLYSKLKPLTERTRQASGNAAGRGSLQWHRLTPAAPGEVSACVSACRRQRQQQQAYEGSLELWRGAQVLRCCLLRKAGKGHQQQG